MSYDARGDVAYVKARQELTPDGKRIPYNEYIKKRTLYYIREIATPIDIHEIQEAIADRIMKM